MIFKTPTLSEKDRAVIIETEELRRRLSHAVAQPRRWTGRLRKVTFARAIQGSNTIEGYVTSVEDAMAVAEGQQPLETDKATEDAIKGYRDAMTYIVQLAQASDFSYTSDLIRSLHFMIQQYDLSKHPGAWRPGAVYVKNEANGEVVYEGAPIEEVPALMAELIQSLITRTADAHYFVRSAMAHLNLVMIHPFSDGNGRMARALQTLVLGREGILEPTFSSIEEFLGRPDNTRQYYKVLQQVGGLIYQPSGDAIPWVRFVLRAHFFQASTLMRRVNEYGQIYELVYKETERRGLPERTALALFDAAIGFRVRNATYRPAADVPEYTAGRDLKLLADHGLLVAIGEKRGRYYQAGQVLKDIRTATRKRTPIVDPFEDAPAAS